MIVFLGKITELGKEPSVCWEIIKTTYKFVA